MQETRVSCTGCRTLDNGYLLVTSGREDNSRTHAGVGFLIAPFLRNSVASLRLTSDRICCLKLRVKGGKFVIVNVYAPHNGHEYGYRQHFFSELAETMDITKTHGEQVVVGDFNARIHNSIGGENGVLGNFCFGNAAFNPQPHPNSNRELLIELCTAKGMCVANTFADTDVEHLVTYHDLWQHPLADISRGGFAQLDLLLCVQTNLWRVRQVRSDRREALASHHFLVEAVINVQVDEHDDRPERPPEKCIRHDLEALTHQPVAVAFAQKFRQLTDRDCSSSSSVDDLAVSLCDSMHAAAESSLPARKAEPKRPWIRDGTLALIAARNAAREDRERALETRLNKQIRKSARADRGAWILGIISSGSWADIKKLKKQQAMRIDSRRLRDAEGKWVESQNRAETFAAHLETVQWAVRPMNTLVERPNIGGELPISSSAVTATEVREAVRALKLKRAAVQVPAEFLRGLLQAEAIDESCWLVKLFQLCWETKTTPTSWHIATVIPVFKKGNPAECDNYRPISLVSVLYKVYATILLRRLKAAGAEGKLWDRQFGFRSKRSTDDALFIVRRRVEQAVAARGGSSMILALDWRKAFDSISPERLLWALRRFGLNEPMLLAVRDIYTGRVFKVADSGNLSDEHPQRAGISQGCPLSPFLFGMVMTVLMTDARAMLSTAAQTAIANDELEDVLYADDTLLIGRSGRHIEEYMAAVERSGLDYGLQIHWGKVNLVSIGHQAAVRSPEGKDVKPQPSMLYLGSTIHMDGKFGPELSRKIGLAHAEFRSLQQVWRSPTVAKDTKLKLFDAYIVSKLRYGVSSAWLLKSDLRRLDGFQARCLRTLLGVRPAYFSRISNEQVRAKAGQEALSETVHRLQLKLLADVLNQPARRTMRDAAFVRGSETPLTAAYVRKVGRPRHNWAEQVLELRRRGDVSGL